MLHALRRGELELSPSLRAESSWLGGSSRMACNDGEPLRVMPPHFAPKLATFVRPIQVVQAVGRCLE
jgi:hypothetical protein